MIWLIFTKKKEYNREFAAQQKESFWGIKTALKNGILYFIFVSKKEK
jgi:hypothetical protein